MKMPSCLSERKREWPNENKSSYRRSAARSVPVGLRVCGTESDARRLFFRDHLGRADWTCWGQIRIKRSTSLPTVPSRGEVRVLLASAKSHALWRFFR